MSLENIPTHGGCAPQSGLVYDMPEADYHTHPALSSTGARRLLRPSCPALFDYERKHPSPPTKSMTLGSAAHRLALGVGSAIVVSDEWDSYRTKDARAWRDTVAARGDIPMLATSDDWTTAREMAAILATHPAYRRLFDPERGQAEASLFWTDDETGVHCRARLDFLPHPVDGQRLIVADYKTTTDPEPGAFARDAATYGYPMQADFYLRGVRALDLDPDPQFVFVAQSTKPPYLVSITYVTGPDLNLAHHRNSIALQTFRSCTVADHWPGYDEVTALPMPAYWRIESEDIIEGAA